MAAEIKVLVVADDPLVRGGLARILMDQAGFMVAGVVASTSLTSDEIEVYQPDVILWDLGWGSVTSSLEKIGEIGEVQPPILLLAPGHVPMEQFRASAVHGYLYRDTSETRIFAALTAVLDGLFVFDRNPVTIGQAQKRDNQILSSEELTARELDVLKLLAQGLPNKSIAYQLGISEHTVKFHINSILGKLDAQSRTDAVVRATRLGWITL